MTEIGHANLEREASPFPDQDRDQGGRDRKDPEGDPPEEINEKQMKVPEPSKLKFEKITSTRDAI